MRGEILLIRHPYLDRFVNSFVISGESHSVLVDTGLCRNRERVLRACQEEMTVLCTHGHFDHTGGHQFLRQKGARALAHPGDFQCYTDHATQWQQLYGQFKGIFPIPPERNTLFWEEVGEPFSPDGALADNEELQLGGVTIRALHTPGHTPGSMCFYLPEEGALFTGDTLMGEGFFGGMPQYSDKDAYIRSLERLSRLEVERVYCDHNEPAPPKTLKEKARAAMEYAAYLDGLVKSFFMDCSRPGEASLRDVCGYVCGHAGKAMGSGTCITILSHLRSASGEFPEAGHIAAKYELEA